MKILDKESAITVLQPQAMQIPVITDFKSAWDATRQIDKVSSALKALDVYYERFQQLIELEIGVLDQLDSIAETHQSARGKTVKTVNGYGAQGGKAPVEGFFTWWVNLNESERNRVKDEARKSYKTIRSIYRSAKSDGARISATEDAYESYKRASQHFQYFGRVNLNNYFKRPSRTKAYLEVDAIKDRCKDNLLNLGAVGCGDGEYVRIKDNPGKTLRALEIRCKSIKEDIDKAWSIYEQVKDVLEENEFSRERARAIGGFLEGCEKQIYGK